MKIIVNKKKLGVSADQILKNAGYAFLVDKKTGSESYVKRLGNYFYPRFHLYIEENGEQISFNLHLDQKQASYEGYHKHNAEYEGENVENEIARLKQIIISCSINEIPKAAAQIPEERPTLLSVVEGNYKEDAKPYNENKKKGFFSRLFGK